MFYYVYIYKAANGRENKKTNCLALLLAHFLLYAAPIICSVCVWCSYGGRPLYRLSHQQQLLCIRSYYRA